MTQEVREKLEKACKVRNDLVRTEVARILHKAIREFEAKGCPEVFDLKVHVDQILRRLDEFGYRLPPQLELITERDIQQPDRTVSAVGYAMTRLELFRICKEEGFIDDQLDADRKAVEGLK